MKSALKIEIRKISLQKKKQKMKAMINFKIKEIKNVFINVKKFPKKY